MTQEVAAAFVGTDGHVVVRKMPRPPLEEGALMVRMKSSGICGTDLEKITGDYTANMILGHEVSGIVSESKSDLFADGDKVIPHHHVACGSCPMCLLGAETMCDRFKSSNFDPCGFAEEFRVARYNVERRGVRKFERISFDSASFVEPLGCCLRGLMKAIPGYFEPVQDKSSRRLRARNVLIVGAGPIGLLHMELVKSILPEVKLVTVDISGIRLDFAQKFENAVPLNAKEIPAGAFSETAKSQTDGIGFDLVIVATGNPSVFPESVRSLRKSGRLLLFGAMHKGSTYSLDLQSMLLNEWSLVSSYATTAAEMDLALKMLEDRRINVEKFVTSKVDLQNVDEAMQKARSEREVKVIVNSN